MKIEWKDLNTKLTFKQIVIIQTITMLFFFATMDCILRGHVSYIDQQRMEREENYRRELLSLTSGRAASLEIANSRAKLISEVLEFSKWRD